MLISIKIWLGLLGLVFIINSLVGAIITRSWEENESFIVPLKKAA